MPAQTALVDEKTMKNKPSDDKQHAGHEVVLTVAEEQLELTKKEVVHNRVKVTRSTTEHDEVITTLLNRETVDVKRVPKGERIDAMPETREENGVIIVPVVEEEVEIVRRLVLKEELHIRKTQQQVPHEEVVTLRKQKVSVHKAKDRTE